MPMVPRCSLPISCPYTYDIRGILRRIEVGNYKGALAALSTGNRISKSNEIDCVDCAAPCNMACKGKNGNIQPVRIKSTLVKLANLLS